MNDGTLEILLRPRDTRGIGVADEIVRRARAAMTPDRHSVLTHPDGSAHFWLADAATNEVYPVPFDEVYRRQAAGPRPTLWTPIDTERTARARLRALLPLAKDGAVAGMLLNALRPRGALRDASLLDPWWGDAEPGQTHPARGTRTTNGRADEGGARPHHRRAGGGGDGGPTTAEEGRGRGGGG
eukprot:gene16961-11685_t